MVFGQQFVSLAGGFDYFLQSSYAPMFVLEKQVGVGLLFSRISLYNQQNNTEQLIRLFTEAAVHHDWIVMREAKSRLGRLAV